jgi:RyR domain-containing protein
MKIEDIARVCHEANRAYCIAIGDFSQLPWENAPEWQLQSAINGVRFHLDNPDAGPSGSHDNWLKEKFAAGWTHGPVKDPLAKRHPCIMPYLDLPFEQQLKDAIFVGIVHAMKPGLA